MKRLLLALPLLLAAGCETAPEPYAPVQSVHYQAIGAEPFWQLTIGDDRIVLRLAGMSEDVVYPRTLPRTLDGITTWQSGAPPFVIVVEATAGPCSNPGGQTFENRVRVRYSGEDLRTNRPFTEELTGCGGGLARP